MADRDIHGARKCSTCAIEKPLPEFIVDRTRPFGRGYVCKPCRRDATKRHYARNKASEAERGARYRANNKEKTKARGVRYRAENKDAIASYNRRWATQNKSRKLETSKRWRASKPGYGAAATAKWRRNNPEKSREAGRAALEKLRSTPAGKIRFAVSAGMLRGLRSGGKQARATFEILGYSPAELAAHLESQFRSGMTWENYGRFGWHIDHIRPLATFEYSSVDSPAFKEAWRLENLQPLWWRENLSKGKTHGKSQSR